MSNYVHDLAVLLFEDFNDRVLYGDEESEEALFNSVEWVARGKSEESRADLYAGLLTVWPKLQARTTLAQIEEVIRKWANI